MSNFNEFIKGFEEAEQPKVEQPKPKEHEITEAKLPESRFLKNDPYYKLVEEKKPKAYREHLFYPENGKIALHNTAGKKIKDFANEEEAKKWVDEYYSPVRQEVEMDDDYERSWGPEPDDDLPAEPKPKFQDELEGIVQGLKEDGQKEYDERFLNDATMHLTKGLSPEEKAEVNKRFKALLDKEGFENITPSAPQPKQGSFKEVFGE